MRSLFPSLKVATAFCEPEIRRPRNLLSRRLQQQSSEAKHKFSKLPAQFFTIRAMTGQWLDDSGRLFKNSSNRDAPCGPPRKNQDNARRAQGETPDE
ncbi:hypothetical protein ACERNI_14525 [Camelimonas sp. ID_303_24]